MAERLRVLILEDNPADAELELAELRKAGFEPDWQRVETEAAYLAALNPNLDLILADHTLPQFDSVRALLAVQARGLDTPFVIVSGTICEDLAVALLTQGAADYVLKDRMARLGQAIVHARLQQRLRQEKRQAEQQIRESEAWFRALIDKTHDGISIVDQNGTILYAGPSTVRLLGYSPEEYVGRNGFDLVHPDDVCAVKSRFEAVAHTPGGTTWATYRARHRDGSWRWIESVATNLLHEPPMNGIVINFRDVTDRKRAEAQLSLQAAALESAANSVVITDREGTITWVNRAFMQVTGYSAEEVIGQNPRILKSGKQDAAFYANLWQTILAGEVWRGELINRRKNGTLYVEEMTITPVRANWEGITHFVAVRQDNTERRTAEEKIRMLNAELEQRVADRTAELAAANKELEAFAYSVSHDLRAPLRAIDGFSDALLTDYAARLDACGRDYLQRVRAAVQRMNRLIEDLLQLSRLGRAALVPELVDLSALAGRVIADLQAVEPRRKVVVRIAPGLVAQGDPCLLEVVLQNLLGNAWKFTSKTPAPRIEFGSVLQPDGTTAFFIRDNGAGFDMNNVERLFVPFQRLHSDNEFPGTGIGLATVQRIIHRHRGRVWAEGAVGRGATVSFTLPVAGDRLESTPPPRGGPPRPGER